MGKGNPLDYPMPSRFAPSWVLSMAAQKCMPASISQKDMFFFRPL